MSIDVDAKIRQLNELRHEYSDYAANDLVRGWLIEWSMADSHADLLIKERDAAMTREQVRAIVFEVLQDLVRGTIKNEPEQDVDGDEHNVYVFDGELFVDRIFERAK